MVAGLQLTSIGSLGPGDWPRLLSAAGGLAAGLGAVSYMIFQASLLLTDEWITLGQMQLEPFNQQLRDPGRRDRRRSRVIARISSELQNYQDEFFGSVAKDIPDLYRQLIDANKKARESPGPEHAAAAADLKRTVDTLMQAANYSYTRSEFAVLRRRLAVAGAVFIAGIVVFAYAASLPEPAASTARAPAAARQSPPRRLQLAVNPGAPGKARGRVQEVEYVEARGGDTAPPRLLLEPLQLVFRQGPVNGHVRVEAERDSRVDPAGLRVQAGPHVGVEPDFLIGVRAV
jgi:hypothetical protein